MTPTSAPMPELLPCPFCGGKVRFRKSHCEDMSDWIEHEQKNGGNNCGLEYSNFHIDGDLIEAWNTRPSPTSGAEALTHDLERQVDLNHDLLQEVARYRVALTWIDEYFADSNHPAALRARAALQPDGGKE